MRVSNDPERRRIIEAFIRSKKVDIVCLLETKLKEMTGGLIRSLGVGRYLDWASISAIGASGGILVFWDSRVFRLIGKKESQYTISYCFRTFDENFQWVFTRVYGPTDGDSKELFWEELGAIRGL